MWELQSLIFECSLLPGEYSLLCAAPCILAATCVVCEMVFPPPVSAKQRREFYSKESAKMAQTAQAIMVDIQSKESAFTSATHIEHVRLMFKVRSLFCHSSAVYVAMV